MGVGRDNRSVMSDGWKHLSGVIFFARGIARGWERSKGMNDLE